MVILFKGDARLFVVWRLFVCLFLCAVCCCYGLDSDISPDAIHVFRIGSDVDKSANREDVIRQALSGGREEYGSAVWLAAGDRQAVVLIDAEALQDLATDDSCYLSLGWPSIWQWFQIDDISFCRVLKNGQILPVSGAGLYRFYYAIAELTTNDASLAIMIDKQYGVMCLSELALKSTQEIRQHQQYRILERGIFYGIFLGLVLCAGFGYYSFRDKTFLWYIFQLVASMLLMSVESPLECYGLLSAAYCRHLYPLVMATFYASSLVFSQYYLDLPTYHPRLNRLIQWFVYVLLLYLVSYALMPPWLRAELLYVFDLLVISPMFMSYYIWWKGRAAGKYFAIATISFIPIYIHYILVELFKLPPFIPLNDMISYGTLFEGIVFPIALVVRARGIVEEKRSVDQDNARLQTEKMRARMLAREAELRMLRFQMNPHFLFNALSSLLVEIPDDPKLALRIAEKLSAYLRYTLTSRELVSLEEEIQAVRQYLELEEIRFEEQLEVQLSLPNELPNLDVPMFCIQPLVENAIKYGMQTSPAPLRIRINIEQQDDGVSIEVANTGQWCEKNAKSTGLGLANVRERLRIYYADSHEFVRTADDGWVRVKLVIRCG